MRQAASPLIFGAPWAFRGTRFWVTARPLASRIFLNSGQGVLRPRERLCLLPSWRSKAPTFVAIPMPELQPKLRQSSCPNHHLAKFLSITQARESPDSRYVNQSLSESCAAPVLKQTRPDPALPTPKSRMKLRIDPSEGAPRRKKRKSARRSGADRSVSTMKFFTGCVAAATLVLAATAAQRASSGERYRERRRYCGVGFRRTLCAAGRARRHRRRVTATATATKTAARRQCCCRRPRSTRCCAKTASLRWASPPARQRLHHRGDRPPRRGRPAGDRCPRRKNFALHAGQRTLTAWRRPTSSPRLRLTARKARCRRRPWSAAARRARRPRSRMSPAAPCRCRRPPAARGAGRRQAGRACDAASPGGRRAGKAR